MKTILMYSPNDLDGVSIYRHWGPMLELEKQGHCKLVACPPYEKTNWQHYKKCDLAFVHRPAKAADYLFLQECEKHGLPVWIDLDDNIFQITDDNDAWEYYSKEENIKFAMGSLRKAKKLTVATERLKNFLSQTLALDSEIIPNAMEDGHWAKRRHPGFRNRVLWRGSKSHFADLLYYETQLRDLIDRNREFKWLFMGMNPYFISRKVHTEKSQPVTWAGTANFVDYMSKIRGFNPGISFVSMIDTEFNQTRSFNGWLEATHAGAVTVAPLWKEWIRPGIINYEGPANFVEVMNNVLTLSEKELKACHSRSESEITNNYLLSKINLKRLELIENLS